MSCIKLKTAKYHLIYSNFLKSSQKPLLNDTNLQIIPVTKERPNQPHHQPQKKSTRSPGSHSSSLCFQPRQVFLSRAFSAAENSGRGHAHFPSPNWRHSKITPGKQAEFRGMLIHTCRRPIGGLGCRAPSILHLDYGQGLHVRPFCSTAVSPSGWAIWPQP